jgi:hypothetical protein
MGTKLITSVLLTLATLLPVSAILADTTIRIGSLPEGNNAVLLVRGDMARITLSGRPDYVLYDRTRNTGILVDTARREYREIDRAILDRYSAMLTGLRENLRLRLRSLPPAQRARLEQQMESMIRLPAAGMLPDLEGIHSQPRGRKTVVGFGCVAHLLLRGNQPVAEVCMATTPNASMAAKDFATMTAMMDFLRELAGSLQQPGNIPGNDSRSLMNALQGVPVAIQDIQNRRTYMVRDVSDEPLDSSLFTAYRGYKKQDPLTFLAKGL